MAIMILLYNLFIRLYIVGIWITSYFNPKIKKLQVGRSQIFKQSFPEKKHKRVWIHCASLGEFEQGRPIIELLKSKDPAIEIVLTFFSPSGYEIRKNYQQADFISYLPADTSSNAKQFINKINPDVVIFVKYEFWYHFLNTLNHQNIPTYLCAAIFRKATFKQFIYGSLFKKMVQLFDKIFVQNNASIKVLESNNIKTGILNGDTRIDRVLQIRSEKKDFPIVEKFAADKNIFVIGSSWPKDESLLLPFINQVKNEDWKFIIAPHNIDDKYIQSIQTNLIKKNIRFSDATANAMNEFEVLIIDNIGMLSSLYQYGKIAYIGGGFGSGIHNTLEPAAFHLPILIGPKYEKFEEANVLVHSGGIFVIHSEQDLQLHFDQLLNADTYQNASNATKNYIDENKGATIEIVDTVIKELS